MYQYTFNEKTGNCYYETDEGDNKSITELETTGNLSFQWRYKHNDAILTIEKMGDKIITARLEVSVELESLQSYRTIKNVIQGWEDEDKGRAVWDEEKKDYVLKYDLPKIFYLFNNKYNNEKLWTFNFNYQWHLILKDKDELKPHYWYYYDYTEELSNFVYDKLSLHIQQFKGQIVAIPGEQGQACQPWSLENYFVNYFYCGEDKDKAGYDFSKETAEEWDSKEGNPALIITFLPTYFKNHELNKGEKLTGTNWFKQIWRVFGMRGVPIVLKCYRAFFYTNLYRNYKEIYERASGICELPNSINGREVGKSDLLVFFNCPWLSKKINYN